MSKLLKTAVASLTVLAALAFGASSAWAAAAAVLPSTTASDWTGVNVLDVDGCTPTATVPCTFHAHSTKSILDGNVANCDVDLTVDVYADGSTEVTNGVVGGPGICPLITTDTDPAWTDQVCRYTAGTSDPADDEVWDGIDVVFNVPLVGVVQGQIYGHLQPDPNGPFTEIILPNSEIASTGHTITADPATDINSTPYEFEDASGNPIELEGEGNEDPCTPTGTGNGAWSELS